MKKAVLGILGGSGLYEMSEIKVIQEISVDTPFGKPSDKIMYCESEEKRFFFLPRHGRGHTLTPSEVNYRANIYALKSVGVTHILAVSAVGIMIEEIAPGDLVIPNQMIDRTQGKRISSFFDNGIVAHVSLADPFCKNFSDFILSQAKTSSPKVHNGGSYLCIEGPRFSSRAESLTARETLKPAIIGMTGCPEAILAREAQISYGMLALATDYDCWHETEEDVSAANVIEVMRKNITVAQQIVKRIVKNLPQQIPSDAFEVLKYAVVTKPTYITTQVKNRVSLLFA